jgi:hypothetical protein
MPSWGPDLVYKLISISMDVINEMRIPENIDDFQYHYRVSRHLFDIILGELYGTLVKNIRDRHSGAFSKKTKFRLLLKAVWYPPTLSNCDTCMYLIFKVHFKTTHIFT